MNDANKPSCETVHEESICYVLVQCKEPTDSGEIQVQMSYAGDESLVSYLLHSAHQMFHNDDQVRKSN